MDNDEKDSGTPSPEASPKGKISDWLCWAVPILTGIFIFITPFPHTTAIAEISFYSAAAAVLVLAGSKRATFILRTPLTIPFGLFLFWGLIGLFFALNKTNSSHDLYAHLAKYFFLFFLLINFFGSRKKFRSLVWAIVISGTIFAAVQMIYDYLILGRDFSMKLGLYSFSEIPSNIIGTITIFALLLALFCLQEETETPSRIILVICLCTLALATLATQTRSALIALAVSLALSFFGNKKAVAILVSVLIVALAVMPVKNMLTLKAVRTKIMADHRLQIWRMYGEMIKDFPVTGIGFGMQTAYDDALLAKYNARLPEERRLAVLYKAPHNLLVDTAVRGGVVGLSLFLYIIGTFTWMGAKIIRKGKNDFIRNWGHCLIAAFIAFFIQGLFENVLSGPPAIVLYTIFGMMTVLWRINRETPEALSP